MINFISFLVYTLDQWGFNLTFWFVERGEISFFHYFKAFLAAATSFPSQIYFDANCKKLVLVLRSDRIFF